jgi:hypothetical protein
MEAKANIREQWTCAVKKAVVLRYSVLKRKREGVHMTSMGFDVFVVRKYIL